MNAGLQLGTVHRGFAFAYGCRPERLDADVAPRFIELELDEETRSFVDRSLTNRPGFGRRLLHRALLGFVSDFDADGFSRMYPMFLLSESQWRRLLGGTRRGRHLDVGAGSGHVTRRLSPLATETVTAETSRAMARRLRRAGFPCIRRDVTESVPDAPYDRITLLNVLDRCARPFSLLRSLCRALAPGGEIVLATPLPFRPFYYEGPTSCRPHEILEVIGATWEDGVNAIVANVLRPCGLEVRALTRAPYISGGDAHGSLYVLDDAVLVCRSR